MTSDQDRVPGRKVAVDLPLKDDQFPPHAADRLPTVAGPLGLEFSESILKNEYRFLEFQSERCHDHGPCMRLVSSVGGSGWFAIHPG